MVYKKGGKTMIPNYFDMNYEEVNEHFLKMNDQELKLNLIILEMQMLKKNSKPSIFIQESDKRLEEILSLLR